MPFHIRNRETERLARELARAAGTGLTEAVHLAVASELRRRQAQMSLWEQTAGLRRQVADRVKHPAPVDKAFRDSLYAERDRVR